MQEFNKRTGMYTLEGFLHALQEMLIVVLSRPAARRLLAAEPGHVPELSVEDAQQMELVLYRTGFPYSEVHDRYDPANLLSAERLYAATLAGELGFTRDASGEVVAPPSQMHGLYGDGRRTTPVGLRRVVESAGARVGLLQFAAARMGDLHESRRLVDGAGEEVRKHRFLPSPLPHRVDSGHSFLFEALWLHNEDCHRTERDPAKTGTPERIGTILHVLAWERYRLTELITKLSVIVRILFKAAHSNGDWAVFNLVRSILSRGIEQELDGRVVEGIMRAAGRRQARGELSRAAVELLLKERVVDALGREAQRMDAQDLAPEHAIVEDCPELHTLARLYISGHLTF